MLHRGSDFVDPTCPRGQVALHAASSWGPQQWYTGTGGLSNVQTKDAAHKNELSLQHIFQASPELPRGTDVEY